MTKSLLFVGERKVAFQEYAEPDLNPNQVRIRTLFSGISHGTEMQVYRGSAPMYKRKFDYATRLFIETDEPEWKYPMKYGYANVGEIIETGKQVAGVKNGDIVYTYCSHETGCVVDEQSVMKLDKGLSPEAGIFVANINTAYNGILDAGINLGETVVIFGQGVVGLLAVQLAKMSGASCVVAVDLIPERLKLSKKIGADITLNPKECKDVAMEIRKLTNNRGADVAIELSGSDRGLNEAIRVVGLQGTVIVMSWYPGALEHVYLAGEFHHNRIKLKCSQVGFIAPELTPRWTVERRSKIALDLLNKLKLKELISHKIKFEEAAKAYELIDKHPEEVVQIVLEY